MEKWEDVKARQLSHLPLMLRAEVSVAQPAWQRLATWTALIFVSEWFTTPAYWSQLKCRGWLLLESLSQVCVPPRGLPHSAGVHELGYGEKVIFNPMSSGANPPTASRQHNSVA